MRTTGRYLDDLYLLADCRQHFLIQAVELIKAATLDEANKDAPHCLEVKLLIAIEHKHLRQTVGVMSANKVPSANMVAMHVPFAKM